VRIDWHVGERDVIPEASGILVKLVGRALEGAPLAFAFDRPRKPVPLAEGIDRQHPAALMTVGVNLPRLADELRRRSGSGPDPGLFLDKLGSLARLALSAGLQKRSFLRRSQRPWPSFLLDRARLVVAPIGLGAVAQHLSASRPSEGGALELARRIVQRLADALRHDGRAAQLEACLDTVVEPTFRSEEVAGMMLGDATASPKCQIESAGVLHAAAGSASAGVVVAADSLPSADEVAGLIRWAWRTTDIARLCFIRGTTPSRQLAAPWVGQTE
jgi:hypothetical protein